MPAITSMILAVTAATAVAGVGMQVAGMKAQQDAADKMAEGSAIQQQGYAQETTVAKDNAASAKAVALDEMKQETLREQTMELSAKRSFTESVRQAQAAHATAIATASAQGASFGSGLMGGLAQIAGVANTNLLGTRQQLQLGQANFGINQDITNERVRQADNASQMADAQGTVARGGGVIQQGQGMSTAASGLSSLGGSLVNAAGSFGKLAGGFTGNPTPTGYQSPQAFASSAFGNNGIY